MTAGPHRRLPVPAFTADTQWDQADREAGMMAGMDERTMGLNPERRLGRDRELNRDHELDRGEVREKAPDHAVSRHPLSPASEDYLETVLELCGENDTTRSVDIAEHLHVSKASVSKAMGILREAGLIEQAHYGQIHLTPAGRERAAEILERHNMIKRFLIEILGIDEETAEQDACRMEHVISADTRDHWYSYLRKVLSGG